MVSDMEVSQVIICPNCQSENRPQARFCMTCGTRLAGAVLQSAQHVEPAVSDSGSEAAFVSQEMAPVSQATGAELTGSPSESEETTTAVSPSPPVEPSVSPAQITPVVPLEAEVQPPSSAPPTTATQVAGETLSPEESPLPPGQPETAALEPAAETPVTVSSAEPFVGEATESTTTAVPANTLSRPAGQELIQEVGADAAPTPVASASGLEPLAIGTHVAGRFEITSLLERTETENVYAAVDRSVCGQCGAAIEAGDAFCSACGVELAGVPPPFVRLRELAEAPVSLEGTLTDHGRWYVMLPAEIEELAEEEASAEAGGWRLSVGLASHPGKMRELDEDSIFVLTLSFIAEARLGPTLGLYMVADGMGGHEGGEIASKLAVQTVAQQVLQRIIWPEMQGESLSLEMLTEELNKSVQAACQRVYEARRERSSDMGTTLTLALVRDGLALIANVGDSRTYVWGPHGLQQLTKDHSVIADLVELGEEPPEAIYTHPQRSLIYRNLGDKPSVEVDIFSLDLQPGYRLILCCDGLWEMIRDEGIEEIMMLEDHPQRTADRLVERANEAGGEDNISVVIVNVEHPEGG